MSDSALLEKWIRKMVEWKHPYSTITSRGRVVSVKNGFLIVKDSVGSEGIKEEWVTYTYK